MRDHASGDGWEIDPQDVAASLEAGSPFRLIDCREEDEFQFCRIQGAEWMPLSRFGEQAHLRLRDPSEALIIYCHHGLRSLQAMSFLRARGFERAQSMRGGIDAWSKEVDPTIPRY